MNTIITEKFGRVFWIGAGGVFLLLTWLSFLPQLAGANEVDGTGPFDVANSSLTAVDDVYTTTEDITLTVDAPGVLANDSLTTLFTLTLTTSTANGNLTLNDDGFFEYTPDENFNGVDGFKYQLQTGSNPAYVYWPFDDGNNPTIDASGNEFSGTINGDSVFTTTVPMTIGTGLALELDGNGDNVILEGISLANRSFSVAFWAKRDQTGISNQYIVSQGTNGKNRGLHIGFRSSDVFTCAFWSNDLDTAAVYTDTVNWHHWSCTYNADTKERAIYLDGQLIASDIASSNYLGVGRLYVGSRFGNTQYLDGLVDDVQIYRTVLSAAQVQAIANGGRPEGSSSRAAVTLNVISENDPPTAVGESYSTGAGIPLTVSAPGILDNDSDSDGETFTVTLDTDVMSGTLDLNLDGSFVYTPDVDALGSDMFRYFLTDGVSNSEVVTTTIDIASAASFPICTGFEDGGLPDFMYTTVTAVSGGSIGRVQVSDRFPYSGEYSLLLDTNRRGSRGYTQQAAIMVVDLEGVTKAQLSFWVREFGDENHPEDGVFISDDGGVTWAEVQSLNGFPNSHTFVSVDLVTAASNAGMALVDNFFIKFQSKDESPLTLDGYAFDDICVREAQADVRVEPTELSLREYADRTQVETVSILNSGSFTLTWNVTEALTDCGSPADLPWVTAVPANGDIGSGESGDFSVGLDVTGLSAGNYNSLLCINSNDPDEPTVPISLTVEVVPTLGELEIAPTTMAMTVPLGYSLTGELVISNMGGTELDFDVWEIDDRETTTSAAVSMDTAPMTVQAAQSAGSPLALDGLLLAPAPDVDEAVQEDGEVFEEEQVVNEESLFVEEAAETSSISLAHPTGSFDIQDSAWVAVDDVPNGRTLYGQAQCPGKNQFYVIGGVDSSRSNINRMDMYDAVFGRWESLTPHPEQLRALGAVCYGGYLYTFGGVAGGNAVVVRTYVYDIANDSWEAGPDIPRAVAMPVVGAWNNKIYLIGGTTSDISTVTNTVSIYDIPTGEWAVGTPLPTPTAIAGYVQAGPYIYVAGGQDDTTYSDAFLRYDTRTDTWESGPALNETRSGLTLAVTEAGFYVMGGAIDEAVDIGTTEIAFLSHDAWPNGTWETLTEPLTDEVYFNLGGFCTETAANGEIWRVGGFDNANVYRNAEYLPVEPCFSQGGDVSWLSEDITSGMVAVSGTQTIEVTFDASGGITQTGVYTAMLQIVHDGSNVNQFVPVTMTVVTNELPVGVIDQFTTTEEIMLTVAAPGVLVNDSDVDNDVLTAVLVSSTANGNLVFNSDGSFEYVPDLDFCGTDQFSYYVSDDWGAQSGVTTAVLNVTCVNDAPVAADDSFTVPENSADNQLQLLANDSDVDEDGLTLAAVSSPMSGTIVVSGTAVLYTPAADFVGMETFTYTVSDGLLTDTAMVTVTVTDGNLPPTAVDDSYDIDENSMDNVLDILANDSDVNGDSLTVTAVSSPANGTAVIYGNVILYTPDADFVGGDSFTYTVSDAGLSSEATVTITISEVGHTLFLPLVVSE